MRFFVIPSEKPEKNYNERQWNRVLPTKFHVIALSLLLYWLSNNLKSVGIFALEADGLLPRYYFCVAKDYVLPFWFSDSIVEILQLECRATHLMK